MDVEVGDFSPWLERWRLTPDGAPFETPEGSKLLPVRAGDRSAMLKIGKSADEQRGSAVMAWWGGKGAAPVLAHDERALLMLRATGPRSLAELARLDDDWATRILCETVIELHAPRSARPPPLPPLERLFAALTAPGDERFARARTLAADLLASQREALVLHADVHHGNVLDFGGLGWRAIDPWGYVGERTYDYANILKNPDGELRAAPGRFRRQLGVAATIAGLEPARLLRWAYAHFALSTAWRIMDGQDPGPGIAMMEIAATELGL
jgi:streptomycin 6-kinase